MKDSCCRSIYDAAQVNATGLHVGPPSSCMLCTEESRVTIAYDTL